MTVKISSGQQDHQPEEEKQDSVDGCDSARMNLIIVSCSAVEQ
jgi:hypothetical protein